MATFNWTELAPGITHANSHVATAVVASAIILVFAVVGRIALGNGEGSIVPAGKVSIRGIFEQIIEFIRNLGFIVMGDQGYKMAPLFASLFFFLFFNNIIGLFPGMTPATENLNTGIAIGFFSFLVYNIYGFMEHGFAYLKHFLGPVLALAPLMLPIEIISHTVRPISLGLRLHGNMMGDHMVLSIFTAFVAGARSYYFLLFGAICVFHAGVCIYNAFYDLRSYVSFTRSLNLGFRF